MTVRGISKSALYKRAVEGDVSQVPIGKTILTNDIEKNSANVRFEGQGQEIETLQLKMFACYGREELQVVRKNLSSAIDYASREILNNGLVKEVSFDKQNGVLNIVKQNGELLAIPGFLCQKDFGVGPAGPCGDRGKDGHDGEDGRHGKKGETGCAGIEGPVGIYGDTGIDGEEGDLGGEGDAGCEGTEGPQGAVGAAGISGFEGSRGFRGDGCSKAETGPAGQAGAALNNRFAITDAPDALSVFWAFPS